MPQILSSKSKKPNSDLVAQKKLNEAKKRVKEIKVKIENHKKNQPPKVAKVLSVREQKKTGDWHIHLRGGIRNLGPIVNRGFLKVAMPRGTSSVAEIPKGESGRLQLAEWIASSKNPLPAEFTQIVFGIIFLAEELWQVPIILVKWGNRPTHPELLDYLANYLIENNWSTKSLIRKIVLSNTYQMSANCI